jgi:1-acyl-sn-glycerol-3-phosphate acyltransferase
LLGNILNVLLCVTIIYMNDLPRWVKRWKPIKSVVYSLVGAATYPGLSVFNKLKVEGMEVLKYLPKTNVLFVSNHQTYFKDVISLLHIFGAARMGRKSKLGLPVHLLRPFTNLYFVAAEETMNANPLSKLLKFAGAITVSRTWRSKGKDVKRERNDTDTKKIDEALQDNWVLTFPQGTTTPFAEGRKGTAHIIKNNMPIVVPIVISGFNEAFDKKGFRFKKKGTTLQVTIKEPISIDYNAPVDTILDQVMHAIEQSKAYMVQKMDGIKNVMGK